MSEQRRAQASLVRTFSIEAAHRLIAVNPDHKCARIHGHSFQIEIEVTGPIDPDKGWVMDYAEIKSAWHPLFEALDHRYLNEVGGLENPTSENLAIWIWNRLQERLDGLSAVTVMETCTARATYRGA